MNTRDVLYLSRTELEEQPDLSSNPEIKYLYLTKNSIRVLYADFLPPHLEHLCVLGNDLYNDGLPPVWPDTLLTLNLDQNHIQSTEIVRHWPSQLKELSLDDNPLTELPKHLPRSLELLSVSYCNLKSLEFLPPWLQRIRAYYNRLSTIGLLPRQLIYAHLAHNCLTSAKAFRYRMPPNLKFLNLDHNQLTELPASLPDTIETLCVANNKLTSLPRTLPKQLRLLVLNHNRIRFFELDWKPEQGRIMLHIVNNCLTSSLQPLVASGKLQSVIERENWHTPDCHLYATQIQKTYRVYKLKSLVRQVARCRTHRNELLEVALYPDWIGRWTEIETLQFFKQSNA